MLRDSTHMPRRSGLQCIFTNLGHYHVGTAAVAGDGLPEWSADAYSEYFKAYSEGWGDFTTDDVERVIGKPACSYATFACDFAQVFGGALPLAA